MIPKKENNNNNKTILQKYATLLLFQFMIKELFFFKAKFCVF